MIKVENVTKFFEEYGFTRTIFAYDAEFFIAREVVVEIVENLVVAKGFAYVLSLEDFRAEICRLYAKRYLFFGNALFGTLFDFVESIDARA